MKLIKYFKERRIQISILLIIILVITQSILSLYLSIKKDFLYEELSGIHRNNLFIEEKFNDHLKWANELIESLATDKEFTGELERTKTEFAQWYFSFEGTREYLALDDERRSVFDKIAPADLNIHNTARLMLGTSSRNEKIEIYLNYTKNYLKEMQVILTKYIELNHKVALEKESTLHSYTILFQLLSISLGITIIAIVSILGYIIIQSIMRNIGIFMNGFERLSQGDLTSTIEHASRDEYNILIRQYNDFVGKISGILLSVKSNASNLAVSSDKMNGIITTFSDSTHQQASLSEEINSSMTQISNEMQNITDATSFQSECLGSLIQIINELSEIIKIMNARMSESLVTVNNISEDARAGEEMLERMKSSMHHIGKSSEEITSIVSIINDISDQINLLSLNAAIEAARAGDSGRGFAVVAHEITKLAARTAESISNIDNLIQHNKSETKQAIVRVSESSDRIRKIMTGVNGINGMIQSINQLMSQQSNINIKVHDEAEKVRLRDAEIQSAVAEQQKGIDEITSSIGHIANLTQASSFGIMEIAENILSLRQMSSDLFGEITNFRIMK